MDARKRIEELADAATAGLRDDAELRLEVRAEVTTHMEEAIAAHQAKGMGQEEALELAVKAFGPVADVAEGLLEANRRRMKLRALTRLAARVVLVPAAVVVALVVFSRLVPLRGAVQMFCAIPDPGWDGGPDQLEGVWKGLTEDEAFLFRGDTTRGTEAARQRAIWEAHPQSKMWYGNYVTHLLADCEQRTTGPTGEELAKQLAELERTLSSPEWQAGLPEGAAVDPKRVVSMVEAELRRFVEPDAPAGEPPTLELVLQELRRGEQLDPDNGRYNLAMAALLADRAAALEDVEEAKTPDGKSESWETLVVHDRRLLDRAMAELLKGARKPRYTTWQQEVLRERFGLLSPVRRFEEEIARIAWAAGLLLPDAAPRRHLATVAPLYGQMLIAEGRRAEGEAFLEVSCPLALKYHADAFTLVEQLVANAAVHRARQYGVAAYEAAGEPEKARRLATRANRLTKPFDDLRERREAGADPDLGDYLERSGGFLDKILMPALDMELVKDVDLGAGRELEHVLAEQIATSAYLAMLLGLMLLCLAAVVWQRLTGGPSVSPLLLLPDWRTLVRILGLGVLAPLAAFYLYTRWSGAAGREFGFTYLMNRFLVELVLLGATLALLTRGMALRAIRSRCERLQIAVPPRRRWATRVAWAVLVALWLMSLAVRGGIRTASGELWSLTVAGGLATVGLLALLGAVRFVYGTRGYGVYCATVARSLIPVFAAAVVLVGVVAHPYLRAREVTLLRAQTALSPGEGLMSFTRAEALMVERMKAKVAEAAREPDKK